MQRILRALQENVLPRLEAGRGALLPPVGEDASPSPTGFAPAYSGSPRHDHAETMWLLEGRAHLDIEGRIFALQAGDFCLISPRRTHAEVYSARTPSYRSLWFAHRAGRTSSVLFSYHPVGRGKIIDYASGPAPPSLEAVLLALQDEMQHSEMSVREAICRPLLLALARLLLRTLQQAAKPDTAAANERSQRALRFLEEHYDRPLMLSDVARAVYISPNHLATVFKRETGQTVIQALTEIRLRHARHLLRENHGTIAQVARACGFGSVEHFSRVFRRAQATPPGRYGK